VTDVVADTCVYSDFKRGDQRAVDVATRAGVVVMTPIVIGELLGGFARGSRAEQNRAELDQFLSLSYVRIELITPQTAERYAQIYETLRQAGKPIPVNDMWIASVALEHGLPVWTTDRHFESIPALRLVRCADDLDG